MRIDITGTSRQSQLNTCYRSLKKAFELIPHVVLPASSDGKVHNCFAVRFVDGVATVYDYKEDVNPADCPDDIFVFSVAAKNEKVAAKLVTLLQCVYQTKNLV